MGGFTSKILDGIGTCAASPYKAISRAGRCQRRWHELGDCLFYHCAREEVWIQGGVQPGRVGEYKLAEIVRRDQLVLYQFISLFQHLTHVYHIEVANVRTEDGFELVIAMLVKSPGRDHVIRLAAKVKMLGKLLAVMPSSAL